MPPEGQFAPFSVISPCLCTLYSLSRKSFSLEYFSTAYRSMNEWVARAQEEKLIKRRKHEELMQQKREEIRQVHVQI